MSKRYSEIREVGKFACRTNWIHLFNSNTLVSALAILNGLECVKANMKLKVLQDNRHTDST